MLFSLTKTYVLINVLCSAVINAKYLFKDGSVKYKRTQGLLEVQKLTFLEHIDQYLVPSDALSITVTTYFIEDLYKGSVKNLPKLEKIVMSRCGIRHISPAALQNLPALQLINLSQNDLQIIEKGIFNYLPVKELRLQKNRIRSIRSEAFDNMPHLEIINLNGNFMREWDSNWFKNTPKLTIISCKRNQIKNLPPRAFANLVASHEIEGMELVDLRIYLSNNSISSIHPRTLEGIDAFDGLWLDGNQIHHLDKTMFSHLVELHYLNVKRNKLKKIEKDIFSSVREMILLDLRYNKLTCLPYELAATIQIIKMNHNDIDCSCLFYLMEKLKANNAPTHLERVEECGMVGVVCIISKALHLLLSAQLKWW